MFITKELIKIFTDWTKLKIRVHTKEEEIYFKEGQIWWINFGQNIGVEINGKGENFERPGLIFKKFSGDSIWVLPISSQIKTGDYYHHFLDAQGKQNTVSLSQLRLVSSKRLIRNIGWMDEEDFTEIRQKIKKLV